MDANTINNKLERALIKNEILPFILGEGEYFIADREYGGHWPLGSYKQNIKPFLEETSGVLPDVFWEKLKFIIKNSEDGNILLDFIVAYLIPCYYDADSELVRERKTGTPGYIISLIRNYLMDNKESLLKDKRGSGVEWNSKEGLWGSIRSNLKLILDRGGPNFL